MDYTRLFRTLREQKGLTLEALAALARRHRNTVINVESGRPVKFKTIAELMQRMGYAKASAEMRSMALLWLEAASGIPFSQPEIEASARKAISGYRAATRPAVRQLEEAIALAGLDLDQIELLAFCVRHPGILAILQNLRSLASELASDPPVRGAELRVADDPPKPRRGES
jgi:transcriptional regulator with XRE-family HTH domain